MFSVPRLRDPSSNSKRLTRCVEIHLLYRHGSLTPFQTTLPNNTPRLPPNKRDAKGEGISFFFSPSHFLNLILPSVTRKNNNNLLVVVAPIFEKSEWGSLLI